MNIRNGIATMQVVRVPNTVLALFMLAALVNSFTALWNTHSINKQLAKLISPSQTVDVPSSGLASAEVTTSHKSSSKGIDLAVTRQLIANTAAPIATDDSANLADQVELGTIHKRSGKGICWALARQLVKDPVAHGFKGNTQDAAAVKHWAGIKAFRDVILDGKYEWKFGEQIGTRGGVAYVYQRKADGTWQIAEYTVTEPSASNPQAGHSTFSLATTHDLATSIATAHFTGVTPTGIILPVPPYEYVYAR